MTIHITCPDETHDFPREIRIALFCDVPMCPTTDVLYGNFIDAHGAAMARGWKERQAPQGRQWLCPACSGK